MGERRKEAIDRVLENCEQHRLWLANGGRSIQARKGQQASVISKDRMQAERQAQEQAQQQDQQQQEEQEEQ